MIRRVVENFPVERLSEWKSARESFARERAIGGKYFLHKYRVYYTRNKIIIIRAMFNVYLMFLTTVKGNFLLIAITDFFPLVALESGSSGESN